MPKPKELLAFGERWRPYRTVASWYMWRAFERAGYATTNKIRPAPPVNPAITPNQNGPSPNGPPAGSCRGRASARLFSPRLFSPAPSAFCSGHDRRGAFLLDNKCQSK